MNGEKEGVLLFWGMRCPVRPGWGAMCRGQAGHGMVYKMCVGVQGWGKGN